MLAVTQSTVNSEFDLDRYLSQMEEPDQIKIPSPNPERRNPLNESFEDKCELSEAARRFLDSLKIAPLSKLQRFIFNQISMQPLVLFRKIKKGGCHLPVCLGLLHRIANEPGKILIVYRTEAKANRYLNKLRELNPIIKTQSYLSPLNSMILNDKRAITKPYRLMVFSLPRLMNLINHKSIELSSVSYVLFIETPAILEGNAADFESFVNSHRQKGKDTKLGFVCNQPFETATSTLSDYFGNLTPFENSTP